VTALVRLPSIAIDTNLFLVLLRYFSFEFEKSSLAERERILRAELGGRHPVSLEQFEALWRLFERSPRRIVTQHVVAEAFSSKMRKRFDWTRVIELLPRYAVEERGCRVADLYALDDFRGILEDLGPTDAGLIYTAREEKATILSEDGQLRSWAHARSVETLTLNQLDHL
jgi:hypothetical protein